MQLRGLIGLHARGRVSARVAKGYAALRAGPQRSLRRRGGLLRPLLIVSALAVATVFVVLRPAAGGPVPASATPPIAGITLLSSVQPHGVLTAVEYQTLTRTQAALKRAVSQRHINWQAAYAACPSSRETPLLASFDAVCRAVVSELHAITTAESAAKNEPACAAKPGATAAGCLLRAYQALADAAGTEVPLDEANYQATVARGFTGTCLATIADTPSAIAHQQQLARVASETATAMRTQNAPQLTQLAPKLGKALSAVLNESGPSKIAVCPHQ